MDAISKKASQLSGQKVTVGAGAEQATSSVNKLSSAANNSGNAFSSLGSKMSGAFNSVKSSLGDVQKSIQEMSGALLGMTAGGAVSGLAWLSKAKSNLYVAEMKQAIDTNKKLGISFDELKKQAEEQAEMGLGTVTSNMKGAYATIMAGGKYMGKSGQNKVDQAGSLEAFYTSRKELMEEEGISSPEQLVRRLTMTSGDMSKSIRAKSLSTALGISLDEPSMKSAQKRINRLVQEGSVIDMKAQIDLRPWDVLDSRLGQLKSSIGDSIAKPMTFVTVVVSNLVETITNIPGGSALIGFAGMALALASALSVTIGVMTPLWNLMKALNITSGISTMLKASEASATVADAGSHALLTGAMEGEFAVTELNNGAQNTSLATRLRLIGANIWHTATQYAANAANMLGIGSLLGLSAAEGTAATGAYALAAGVWAFLSPLLPFIAAGAILVGILALIADKLGILKPLISAVKKAFSGDFGGAWKSLTHIKMPTMEVAFAGIKDVFAGIFNGTTFFSVITRLLGVPLYKLIDFAEQIRDLIKKIRDFVDYIIGLFYKYLYMPLKGIWDSVIKIVEKVFGKTLTGEDLKNAFMEAAKSNNALSPLATRSPEGLNALFDAIASGNSADIQATKTKYGISDPEYNAAKDLINMLSSGGGATGAGATSTTLVGAAAAGAMSAINDKFTKDVAQTQENLNNGKTGMSASSWSIFNTLGYGASALWGAGKGVYGYLTKNAVGGEVTKSGLAWVDSGEPIIPASVARDSNLINLLEEIASSGGSSSKNGVTIVVNMDYKSSGPGTGNGRYLDDFAFERAVKNIIGKCTRTYGSY